MQASLAIRNGQIIQWNKRIKEEQNDEGVAECHHGTIKGWNYLV